MEKRFDIHTHILPGIDDGSKNMECTIQMLKAQIAEGVTDVIATPHFDMYENKQDIAKVHELFESVKKEIANEKLDINIYCGCEILYSSDVIDEIKNNNVPMIADSKYCLVEFYPDDIYNKILEAVGNIIMAGKIPIIAHVERYECLFGKEDRIRELIKQGAYIQVNSSSFQGGLFDKRAKFCKGIFRRSLVHFIGSDCHNLKHRAPDMEKTYQILVKAAGEDMVKKVMSDNPTRLVSGKYL